MNEKTSSLDDFYEKFQDILTSDSKVKQMSFSLNSILLGLGLLYFISLFFTYFALEKSFFCDENQTFIFSKFILNSVYVLFFQLLYILSVFFLLKRFYKF